MNICLSMYFTSGFKYVYTLHFTKLLQIKITRYHKEMEWTQINMGNIRSMEVKWFL